MKKKEAIDLARDIKEILEATPYNTPEQDFSVDLFSFEIEGKQLNVFTYIGKQKGTDGHRWYSVYGGVEYEGGDTIYADYENSTEHLRITELADSLYHLANKYMNEENLQELRQMIKGGKK